MEAFIDERIDEVLQKFDEYKQKFIACM